MMLEPERAAAFLAERLRRSPAAKGGSAVVTGSSMGSPLTAAESVAASPGSKDWLVRRTLEELGIRFESDAALQDLKGFLIASPRGAEIVVSQRLTPEERLLVYAHLLAHALLEESQGAGVTEDHPARSFFSRLEYVEGREPQDRSSAERRVEVVADALARAILHGRLDAAPQYTYRRQRQPMRGPSLRATWGRIVLDLCHRTSLALFWRLPPYQKLRSRPEITQLVHRLEGLVRVAYAC